MDGTCAKCGEDYYMRHPDCMPTKYCNQCAHDLAEYHDDLLTVLVEASLPLEVLVTDADQNGCGTIAPAVLELMRQARDKSRMVVAKVRRK